MVYLIIISSILSIVFQNILSLVEGYTYEALSFFVSFIILINICSLKMFFENDKKYLIYIIVMGLVMDITISHTFIFNTCILLLIYFFIKAFHFFFPYNLITINISNFLSICIYHIISFLVLNLVGYSDYNVMMLLKIITHNIIGSVLVSSFLYIFYNYLKNRLELREIR